MRQTERQKTWCRKQPKWPKMNLATTYTNSYITQIIHTKNRCLKKMDSSLIPRCLGISSIIYGKKVGYCLEQKKLNMKTIRKMRLYKFIRVSYRQPLTPNVTGMSPRNLHSYEGLQYCNKMPGVAGKLAILPHQKRVIFLLILGWDFSTQIPHRLWNLSQIFELDFLFTQILADSNIYTDVEYYFTQVLMLV